MQRVSAWDCTSIRQEPTNDNGGGSIRIRWCVCVCVCVGVRIVKGSVPSAVEFVLLLFLII